MKPLSKKQLRKQAKEKFFDKMPTLKGIYATEDGNFFYPSHFNAAASHAGQGKLYYFTPGGDEDETISGPQRNGADAPESKKEDKDKGSQTETPEYKANAKDTIAVIKAAKTPEELSKIEADYELSKDKRSTVVDAWNKAKEELGEPNPDGSGSAEPKSPAELVELINGVKEESELDKLEEDYNLSKHSDESVVKAFEAKESEFLD